jgi:hypothetical protein
MQSLSKASGRHFIRGLLRLATKVRDSWQKFPVRYQYIYTKSCLCYIKYKKKCCFVMTMVISEGLAISEACRGLLETYL